MRRSAREDLSLSKLKMKWKWKTHAVMCVAYLESRCFFLFQLVHWKCLLNEEFYKWGVLVWYLDPIQWAYLVCSRLIDATPFFVTLAKLILSRIFCGQVEMCQFPWTLTGIVIHMLEWCYWYYWSLLGDIICEWVRQIERLWHIVCLLVYSG